MSGRDVDEDHRASTPLELFFDLCFVVAIAFAASGLHHALQEDHVWEGIRDFLAVFFAIWWAWMNFTWFASGYDTDDVPYRIATFVQIAGALILAAGVPRAVDGGDFDVMVWGYVIMRLALVTQWLRAAYYDEERRPNAIRNAVGVTVVQCLWVARMWVDTAPSFTFVALVLADLAVPVWAARATRARWHPEHLEERYGLFTIIVLGEAILASTIAFQVAIDGGANDVRLLTLCGAALIIVFTMWWLYFDHPRTDLIPTIQRAFFWGYGHYFVFVAIAAAGVGIELMIDYETGDTKLSPTATDFAMAIPVAMYLLGVWALHLLRDLRGVLNIAFPAAAVFVLLAALTPQSMYIMAAIMVGLLVLVITQAPHIEQHAQGEEH